LSWYRLTTTHTGRTGHYLRTPVLLCLPQLPARPTTHHLPYLPYHLPATYPTHPAAPACHRTPPPGPACHTLHTPPPPPTYSTPAAPIYTATTTPRHLPATHTLRCAKVGQPLVTGHSGCSVLTPGGQWEDLGQELGRLGSLDLSYFTCLALRGGACPHHSPSEHSAGRAGGRQDVGATSVGAGQPHTRYLPAVGSGKGPVAGRTRQSQGLCHNRRRTFILTQLPHSWFPLLAPHTTTCLPPACLQPTYTPAPPPLPLTPPTVPHYICPTHTFLPTPTCHPLPSWPLACHTLPAACLPRALHCSALPYASYGLCMGGTTYHCGMPHLPWDGMPIPHLHTHPHPCLSLPP